LFRRTRARRRLVIAAGAQESLAARAAPAPVDAALATIGRMDLLVRSSNSIPKIDLGQATKYVNGALLAAGIPLIPWLVFTGMGMRSPHPVTEDNRRC